MPPPPLSVLSIVKKTFLVLPLQSIFSMCFFLISHFLNILRYISLSISLGEGDSSKRKWEDQSRTATSVKKVVYYSTINCMPLSWIIIYCSQKNIFRTARTSCTTFDWFTRPSVTPVTPHAHHARGAFFAWHAPILSWPRIMCSQVRMLKFLEPPWEMP